jgi:DNA-binding response OmpR family regulator
MAEFKVLCAAHDPILKEQLCSALASFGYDVWGTTRVKHAVALLSAEDFDLLVLGSGFACKEKRELSIRVRDVYQTPVLLVGDAADLDDVSADGQLYAPYEPEALVGAVERLLRKKALAAVS